LVEEVPSIIQGIVEDVIVMVEGRQSRTTQGQRELAGDGVPRLEILTFRLALAYDREAGDRGRDPGAISGGADGVRYLRLLGAANGDVGVEPAHGR
jgi:hypothetical protein